MYEFERSVLSKEQLAQKTGKDMGDDVMGAEGECGVFLSVHVTFPLSVTLILCCLFAYI